MAADKKQSKANWSKMVIPPELADLIHMIGKSKKYDREDVHFFLYHLLMKAYPQDVEKLTDYLETRWLEEKPTGEQGE